MRKGGAMVVGIALGVPGCYVGLPDSPEATAGAATDDDDGGDDEGDDDDGADGDGGPAEADHVAIVGLRRLTAREYDDTLRDVLLDEQSNAALILPTDALTPFDNDYTTQLPSEALVEAAELLATDAADRLFEDPPRMETLLGCTPTGPADEPCLRTFVQSVGRRVLRRPLTDAEVEIYLHGDDGLEGAVELADTAGDFGIGVHVVVRTLLQDVEFLYRVEVGTPVPDVEGLYALNDFEVASRLSYLLWGSAPDDWMLDRAEAGGIAEPDDVVEVATMMLQDERAVARINRFHALWLGYETLPFSGTLADAMQAETRGLIERIVFDEDRPWQDLFRSTETFVGDALAEHYGLTPPGSVEPVWVDYGDSRRAGLLSHGTFLSNGGKFGDTSPVQRGKMVRTRVFCQDIPPPPPGVDVDQPPQGEAALCKRERYGVHAEGGCASCHDQIDPVGFGLEAYGPLGRFREFEVDNPDTPEDETVCEIDGEGELVGIGPFSGPAELAELALQAGFLDACVKQQLYRFVVGRYELTSMDVEFINAASEAMGEGEFTFRELLLQFVGDETFGFRREDVG
ncbi:MAG: DUF1592 domain-containing protein [Myxococcota bacterium]